MTENELACQWEKMISPVIEISLHMTNKLVGWLVIFSDISTFVGYFKPNPVYYLHIKYI